MNNDKDILNIYLLLLKSNTEVYVHGTLESSNEDIRKLIKSSLDETMKSQADTFNIMADKSWYQVENVKTEKIKKTYNKIIKNSEQQ